MKIIEKIPVPKETPVYTTQTIAIVDSGFDRRIEDKKPILLNTTYSDEPKTTHGTAVALIATKDITAEKLYLIETKETMSSLEKAMTIIKDINIDTLILALAWKQENNTIRDILKTIDKNTQIIYAYTQYAYPHKYNLENATPIARFDDDKIINEKVAYVKIPQRQKILQIGYNSLATAIAANIYLKQNMPNIKYDNTYTTIYDYYQLKPEQNKKTTRKYCPQCKTDTTRQKDYCQHCNQKIKP